MGLMVLRHSTQSCTLNWCSCSLSFSKAVLQQLASTLCCIINLFQNGLVYSPKHRSMLQYLSWKISFSWEYLALTTFFFGSILQQNFQIVLCYHCFLIISYFSPLNLVHLGFPPTTVPKYLLFKNSLLTAKSRLSLFLFACFLLLLLFSYFLYVGLSDNLTQLVFVH